MTSYPYQRYRALAIRERNKTVAHAYKGLRRWIVDETHQPDRRLDELTVADKARFVL